MLSKRLPFKKKYGGKRVVIKDESGACTTNKRSRILIIKEYL